ncbi:MAG TPA: ribosome maturation factor RimM [Methylophaga aminisulfidivorans]|uniref:Ribosome maturation factor RimM n=2 Tax=root TaxID=1 RepID=A0A7C1VR48_9GAMM|nr:ribosome maturation factor RimM [Methylophaga aminisulfidivorans]HEC75586.1 ribosome maturation factor RimM [Methylophaga aminisulfidivorans]
MTTADEFISVGKISAAFGVKGWVKIYSFTEPRANILQYSPLYMSRRGEWIEVKVTGGRTQGKGVVMGIDNVTDRDQVQALIGAELAIKKSQLEPVEEDEFYWNDLEGLTVLNISDEVIGVVDHLMETGANDVLVVKKSKQAEILIPFVMDEIVKQVDLDKSTIIVDWSTDY